MMTDRSVLSKQEGRTCPDALELARLHAKLLQPDAARRLLDHLADCASCADDYKLVAGMNEDEPADAEMEQALAALSLNTQFGRRALALKMSRRSRRFTVFHIAAAVATAAMVLTGGWYLHKRRETTSVQTMVADAYSQGRTTQFRLGSGGSPAALAQQSGGASLETDALLKARVEIEKKLRGNADDALLLTALGETSVLGRNLGEASATLERAYHAAGTTGNNAALDLATVYALRALQSESDAPLRDKALALLGDYIAARPRNSAAYFNRAVIREMGRDYSAAAEDFRQSLRYEQDDAWRHEIQIRLKQLATQK